MAKLRNGLVFLILWGLLLITATPVLASGDWYNDSWHYRKEITIDHTKVPNSNQSNFPVLISLTDADLQSHTQSDGHDLLFTDATGTNKIAYQREQYLSTTGVLVAWVKIADLSYTTDTVIYLYYGNTAASDQQDAAGGVWDSHFKGVWHANDATPTTISDSTTNLNTGNKYGTTGPVETSGKIGRAQSFDGLDAYIYAAPSGTLSGTFTVSTWAKVTDSEDRVVIGTRSGVDMGFDFKFSAGESIHGDIGNGSSWITNGADAGLTYASDTWYHITYVVTPTGYRIYIDGSEAGSDVYVSNTPLLFDATHLVYMGQVGYDEEWFSGAIDEVRISDVPRSADWIKAEYNNQSNPAAFYSIGAEIAKEVTPTPTPSSTPAAGSCNGSCGVDSDCRGGNGSSDYVCYKQRCRLATNVNDEACRQISSAASATTQTSSVSSPQINQKKVIQSRVAPISSEPTVTEPTPTVPTAPALFDIASEPIVPARTNVVSLAAVLVASGTFLAVTAIFTLQQIKRWMMMRKIKNEVFK